MIDDADGVGGAADFGLGGVGPGAVLQAEFPGVPGAHDLALFHVATRQRGSLVGAEVADGEVLSLRKEQANHRPLHRDRLSAVLGQVAHLGHLYEFPLVRLEFGLAV